MDDRKEGGKVATFVWAGRPLILPEVPESGQTKQHVVGLQMLRGSQSPPFGLEPVMEKPNCPFIMSHAIEERSCAISTEKFDKCCVGTKGSCC